MASSFLLINVGGDRLLINVGDNKLRIDDGLSVDGTAVAVSGTEANMTTDILFSSTAAGVSGASASLGIPRKFSGVAQGISGSNSHLSGPTRFQGIAAPFSASEATIDVDRALGGTAEGVSEASGFLSIAIAEVDIGELLQDDVVRPAVFVDLELDEGTVTIWSGMTDLDVRGVVYRSLNGWDAGAQVRESIGVDSLGTDFRLSGLQLEFVSISLNENYQGRIARIYLGLMDQRGLLRGRELVYTGYLDNMPITLDGRSAEMVIQMASILSRNTTAKGLRYSKEDQACVDEGDTLFDFVTGLNASQIEWGGTANI